MRCFIYYLRWWCAVMLYLDKMRHFERQNYSTLLRYGQKERCSEEVNMWFENVTNVNILVHIGVHVYCEKILEFYLHM